MGEPVIRGSRLSLLSLVNRRFQFTNPVSFSSAHTTKRFPLPRCASAIQIVRPRKSTAETQPQLQPALLTDRQLFPSTAFDCFDFDYGVDPSLPASDNPNAFIFPSRSDHNTVASRAQIDKVDSAPDGCCGKILARVIEGESVDYHSLWYAASAHFCPASTAIGAN